MTDSLPSWIPALALAFGAYQYWRNSQAEGRKRSREKATEAANEVAEFRRDPNCELALSLIDYQDMKLSPSPNDATSPPAAVTPGVFVKALRYHLDDAATSASYGAYEGESKTHYDPQELRIRGIFDDFFARLERIDALIQADVIGRDQFGDLFSYWLRLIGETPLPEDMELRHFTDPQRKALWRYIRKYEFNGVVRLFERYGRAAKPGIDPEAAFRPKSEAGESAS